MKTATGGDVAVVEPDRGEVVSSMFVGVEAVDGGVVGCTALEALSDPTTAAAEPLALRECVVETDAAAVPCLVGGVAGGGTPGGQSQWSPWASHCPVGEADGPESLGEVEGLGTPGGQS